MHLARADFFITLFEVDLRFRKIDPHAPFTQKIPKTLNAFLLQNNFGERVFLRGNFIESFFQNSVFECELQQSCRYAIFLGTGEAAFEQLKGFSLLENIVENRHPIKATIHEKPPHIKTPEKKEVICALC